MKLHIFLALLLAVSLTSFAQTSGVHKPPAEETELENATDEARDEINQEMNAILEYEVTGDFTDPSGDTGVFKGHLNLTGFKVEAGKLVAIARMTDGSLTDARGQLFKRVGEQEVVLPVTSQTARCKSLKLTLGPSNLSLQGHTVNLELIPFVIDGSTPEGKMVSTHLCALGKSMKNGTVANLTGHLTTIVRTLSRDKS